MCQFSVTLIIFAQEIAHHLGRLWLVTFMEGNDMIPLVRDWGSADRRLPTASWIQRKENLESRHQIIGEHNSLVREWRGSTNTDW